MFLQMSSSEAQLATLSCQGGIAPETGAGARKLLGADRRLGPWPGLLGAQDRGLGPGVGACGINEEVAEALADGALLGVAVAPLVRVDAQRGVGLTVAEAVLDIGDAIAERDQHRGVAVAMSTLPLRIAVRSSAAVGSLSGSVTVEISSLTAINRCRGVGAGGRRSDGVEPRPLPCAPKWLPGACGVQTVRREQDVPFPP